MCECSSAVCEERESERQALATLVEILETTVEITDLPAQRVIAIAQEAIRYYRRTHP